MTIPGIGSKTAMLITQELGVSTVEGIEKAIHDGALAALPRMGQRTADNILRHIQSMRTKDGRTPIGQALAVAEETVAALRAECPTLSSFIPPEACVAGRRPSVTSTWWAWPRRPAGRRW